MSEKEIEDLLNTIEDNIPIDEIRSVDTASGLTEYELDEESYQYQSLKYIKELQQENKQLKEQLQQSEEVIQEAIEKLSFIDDALEKDILNVPLCITKINKAIHILNKYKKEDKQ